MEKNINTKEYWDSRFLKNWNKNGEKQTTEYAKANVKNIPILSDFTGTILDFGCALGDAIPVYAMAFPKAKLIGIDLSETAIDSCIKKYGRIADFFCGSLNDVPFVDVIIVSHVMEHITDDKFVVAELLKKCNNLFVFVPFKENPLFIEHVNYYEDNYYHALNPLETKIFKVQYFIKMSFKEIIKNFLRLHFSIRHAFSKDIIMFHFKKGI